LSDLIETRGYRVVRSDELSSDEPRITDALCQADIALVLVDTRSPTASYARGLLHGASVPTIELTTVDHPSGDVPAEFTPRVVEPEIGASEVCSVASEQLTVAEEDFLELPNQEKVAAYFRVLVDVGSGSGRYSNEDHERLVSVVMGDNYTVGQAGAVGPGSHAENISFVQQWNQISSSDDPSALAAELSRLRQHLRTEATEPEHDVAIAALAEAEMKAGEGDGPAALEKLSGLSRLKSGGKWAFGAATTIGTTVAAAALKTVLGL
jgi:hypothetical protein